MPVITRSLGISADTWTQGFPGVPELKRFGAAGRLLDEEPAPREGRGFA